MGRHARRGAESVGSAATVLHLLARGRRPAQRRRAERGRRRRGQPLAGHQQGAVAIRPENRRLHQPGSQRRAAGPPVQPRCRTAKARWRAAVRRYRRLQPLRARARADQHGCAASGPHRLSALQPGRRGRERRAHQADLGSRDHPAAPRPVGPQLRVRGPQLPQPGQERVPVRPGGIRRRLGAGRAAKIGDLHQPGPRGVHVSCPRLEQQRCGTWGALRSS